MTDYFEEVSGVIRLKVAHVGLFSFWAQYKGASTQKDPQNARPFPEGLYAELSKSTVVADGRDYAEVMVYYEGRRVTGGINYFDMDKQPVDNLFSENRYRTTTVGQFTFYVSYLRSIRLRIR